MRRLISALCAPVLLLAPGFADAEGTVWHSGDHSAGSGGNFHRDSFSFDGHVHRDHFDRHGHGHPSFGHRHQIAPNHGLGFGRQLQFQGGELHFGSRPPIPRFGTSQFGNGPEIGGSGRFGHR